jgi:hypothetical protein
MLWTVLLILAVAYVAIVYDNLIMDVRYGGRAEWTYYLTMPWLTVTRTGAVIARAAKSVWSQVTLAAALLWDKLAE